MEQELDKASQRSGQTPAAGERTRSRPVLVPPTDIYETKDALVVLADMPGMTSDNIDISLEDRVLTIRGQMADQEHPGYRQVYAEYGEADYERTFTLSEDIDRAGIQASLEKGVLRLVLPKAEAAKPRKIQVKAG